MGYPPISGCVFIRNTFRGAFCLFESLASVLPLVDDVLVLDLGSTDGTLEILQDIASSNPRVRLESGAFPREDAGAFADLANDLIDAARHETVWFWQADEIPHQKVLRMARDKLAAGERDLAFWRIQYRANFQEVKWFPHVVHRIGTKGRFHFVGDGMNSDRYLEPPICSDYGGEYFQRWGQMGQEGVKPYVDQMILDVSLVGGFRDNIPERRAMHSPFWHEEPKIPWRGLGGTVDVQLPASEWKARALADDRWTRTESPYDIPYVMRFHVGKPRYQLRQGLLDALKEDRAEVEIGL